MLCWTAVSGLGSVQGAGGNLGLAGSATEGCRHRFRASVIFSLFGCRSLVFGLGVSTFVDAMSVVSVTTLLNGRVFRRDVGACDDGRCDD